MRSMTNDSRALVLGAALAAVLAPPALGQLDPSRVRWSKVTLEGKKLTVKLSSDIALESAPPGKELIAVSDANALRPRGAASQLLTLHTRVLSQDSRVRFWFESEDALALQRSELSITKKRKRHRTYRYTDRGVFAHTMTPGEGEENAQHERWSRVESGFTDYPAGLEEGLVVTEASALLYIVPASDLTSRGETLVHVYSKGTLNQVKLGVKGRERLKVDYVEEAPGGQRQVKGPVEALRVELRPRPPAGESKSNFKLLGLEGDVDLFVDPETRVLLQLAGRVSIAGSVKLRLKRAVLR